MKESLLYRQRPVVVEAIRWTADNTEDVIRWAESLGVHGFTVGDDNKTMYLGARPPMAEMGDWIVRAPDGGLFPCKPMRFERDYVEVIGARTVPDELGFDELAKGHP